MNLRAALAALLLALPALAGDAKVTYVSGSTV